MLTTVVGSYPALPQEPSCLKDKISAFMGSYDPYQSALELAVQDQVKAGVDLISDGQVRGDMLEIFAISIPGMAMEDKTPKILGKIMPAPHSIGASDLILALKTAQKISPDFNNNRQILSENKFNDKFKGIKGIVTGPTTLALSSRIEGFYKKDKKEKAIIDLAGALKKEVRHLQDAGASVIQIDEPFLSTGTANMATAKKAVAIMAKDLEVPLSMHVCGNVADVLGDLLRFEVDIVDCEFAGIPANLDALEKQDLGNKKIGLGCIDTKTERVEGTEEVLNIIKRGIEIVGVDNMILDPDCGMRKLSRDAAFSKLKKMTEAVKWLS
jgi:5-methyltetrahydropteroyltriglutamate--homocysteine methyltransferase